MAFFLSGLKYDDVMVCGVREGVSQKGVKFVTLTVVDIDGNTNNLSSSDPENMEYILKLKQGDKVDLRVVCAGGPQRQYAMIARGSGSVKLRDVTGY